MYFEGKLRVIRLSFCEHLDTRNATILTIIMIYSRNSINSIIKHVAYCHCMGLRFFDCVFNQGDDAYSAAYCDN